MGFSIGDSVGDYRILEELGRGGMGQVFKVEHTITRRVEAMKILAGGRPDVQQAARSLREIQLQASLDHPNIAAVHNAFWAGDDLVLVMELIEGRSLRSVLEDGRLPLATTLDYAGQALSALSYAHAHGVIHRDISPANMMIGPDAVLKLTDFGLAKGSLDARLSQSGAPLGSLWYMPPEQVRGSATDARSDIYSLGAVLYELASGRKPFDGESAYAIMADQVAKPPAPLSEVDPSLPQALSAAVLRALDKEPQVLLGICSAVNPPRTASQAWAGRSRVSWVAVALVGLALTAGSMFALRWRGSPTNVPAAALQSPNPLAGAGKLAAPAQPPAKPVKHVARKPVTSSPSRLRRALRAIWPFSRRDKSASSNRQPAYHPTDP